MYVWMFYHVPPENKGYMRYLVSAPPANFNYYTSHNPIWAKYDFFMYIYFEMRYRILDSINEENRWLENIIFTRMTWVWTWTHWSSLYFSILGEILYCLILFAFLRILIASWWQTYAHHNDEWILNLVFVAFLLVFSLKNSFKLKQQFQT